MVKIETVDKDSVKISQTIEDVRIYTREQVNNLIARENQALAELNAILSEMNKVA